MEYYWLNYIFHNYQTEAEALRILKRKPKEEQIELLKRIKEHNSERVKLQQELLYDPNGLD